MAVVEKPMGHFDLEVLKAILGHLGYLRFFPNTIFQDAATSIIMMLFFFSSKCSTGVPCDSANNSYFIEFRNLKM